METKERRGRLAEEEKERKTCLKEDKEWSLLLGMEDWLVHQGEGWQGGFTVASLPSTVHT